MSDTVLTGCNTTPVGYRRRLPVMPARQVLQTTAGDRRYLAWHRRQRVHSAARVVKRAKDTPEDYQVTRQVYALHKRRAANRKLKALTHGLLHEYERIAADDHKRYADKPDVPHGHSAVWKPTRTCRGCTVKATVRKDGVPVKSSFRRPMVVTGHWTVCPWERSSTMKAGVWAR